MGTQFIIIASLCASTSNYFMRRSIDVGGSTDIFLTVQLFLSFLVAILLNPVRTGLYEWSFPMAAFGLIAGIILGTMMSCLGKALEAGPPGLTFATVNSASVMPSVLMAAIFGSAFDYTYTLWNFLGSSLVIAGLFWAGAKTEPIPQKNRWMIFVSIAFILHMMGLAFLQWRALFINYPGAEGLLLAFDLEDAKNQWFMPILFAGAFFLQFLRVSKSSKLHVARKIPHAREFFCGILGGIANGAATFFLMLATEHSSSLEHAMLFPIFAVSVIVFCNLWGRWLYSEKVNWAANGLCLIGLFVGTVDWQALI